MSYEPASPCTNICSLDRTAGWCVGCLRTRKEIAGWSAFSPDEKRRVLKRCALRGSPAATGQSHD